jgi:hypothetical protein
MTPYFNAPQRAVALVGAVVFLALLHSREKQKAPVYVANTTSL